MATFRGTSGSDRLKGTWFNDLFESSGGNDVLDGGPGGSDTVSYATNAGPVVVNLATGSAQKYELVPTGGSPVLRSTDSLISIENVIGSRYDDTITGDAGSNTIAGLGGRDIIDGRGGIDTIDYSASAAGINVDLSSNTAAGGDATGDSLTSIENVIGTGSSDTIIGTNTANRLEGGGGNDTLSGGDGIDTLIGGGGRDQLRGGLDPDTFVYSFVTDSEYAVSNGQPLYDRLSGFENGIDTLDLSRIDANVGLAGDQQFVVVSSFTGTAGELVLGRIITNVGDGASYDSMVVADVNGDALGDFAINFHWQSAPGISATDILL